MGANLKLVEPEPTEPGIEIEKIHESMEDLLARFQAALGFRKKYREQITDVASKSKERRDEAIEALRKVAHKSNDLKLELAFQFDELKRVDKNKALAIREYKNLLDGQVSKVLNVTDGGSVGFDATLAEHKDKFLADVKAEFERLENEINDLKEKRGQLEKLLDDLKHKMMSSLKRHRFLSMALKVLDNEIAQYNIKLADTIGEEDVLLEGYNYFGKQLSGALSIPISIDKVLARNIEAEKDLANAISGND